MDKFRSAFKWHKTNAERRGIHFLFTFDEWKGWWLASGRWEQRGVGRDRYCMCRFNDAGPYTTNNVYCATNGKNLSDANLGKPKSAAQRSKIAAALTGQSHDWSKGDLNPMHRPEVKVKMTEAIGGMRHYRAQGVTTPGGTFESTKAAAAALGIPKPTVEWRCRKKKPGYTYGLAIA